MKTLSARKLIKIRAILRVSQYELCKMTGVSRFKISLYECGYGNLNASEKKRIENFVNSALQAGSNL